jgi:RecA-family ATPase
VDRLRTFHAGGDENSAKDMGRLIDQVEWLKKNLGAAALIIHHTG